MKKLLPIFDELLIWIRGRFALTSEERVWLLLILIICWTGLLGRYFYLKSQEAELLSPQQIEQLPIP